MPYKQASNVSLSIVKIMNIQIKKLVSGMFSSAGTLAFRLYFYFQGHTY